MATEQFRRKALLHINEFEVKDLRIAFNIDKTLLAHPNQAEVRIWNLSDSTRNRLDKDVVVSLSAGYGFSTSQIFQGTLSKVDHTYEGPDIITYARIGDGEKEVKQARINTSFKGNSSYEKIVTELLKTMKVGAGNAIAKAKKGDIGGAIQDFVMGNVLTGNSYQILQDISKNYGMSLSIQDGQAVLLEDDQTLGILATVLGADTGMVGSPKQAEQGQVKVRALLNAELKPGYQVNLNAREIKGFFRIEKVSYKGDTHGSDWFADLEMKRIGV